MNRIRLLTAGESHGKVVLAILEGIPAGLPLVPEVIDRELARRQAGYGRGGRMKIEKDRVEILSGVRFGETLGSPISLQVINLDFEKWSKKMSIHAEDKAEGDPFLIPRPGHADLPGGLKYNRQDFRDILERASARETTARVAAGAVCKKLLNTFGIRFTSHVVSLGGIEANPGDPADFDRINQAAEGSDLRCADEEAAARMRELIDRAKQEGETLGGVFEILVQGLPVGLGSHVHWDRKIDGRIAQAILSIQAIKGVEIGMGFRGSSLPGSQFHDEIGYERGHFLRSSNRAGGTEGGMTNGEMLVIRGAMKPIATVLKGLKSVHSRSKEAVPTKYERSDVTAVPAAGVVGEAAVALIVADAFCEKFGGDSLGEMQRNYQGYLKQIQEF